MVIAMLITNIGNEVITVFATGKNLTMAINSVPASLTYDTTKGKYQLLHNSDSTIKVDNELHQYFNMKVDGQAKVYALPQDNAELNSNFIRPESFVSNDFTIYNDHFIKVSDNGHSFFVNLKDTNYEVNTTSEKIKLIGDDVVYAERNPNMDISSRTYLTAGEIDEYLGGTALYGIGQAVIECEHKYGVNAIFILAVAIEESGWGSSYLARTRNNLFGIAAYDSNVDAAFNYDSKADCIDYFCRLITKEYFSIGRTDVYSVGSMYCTSSQWGDNITRNMRNIINHIK